MATPIVLFAPQALDIVRTAATTRPTPTHDDAVGGLLIGKRDGDALIVLAASEPGPNADDRRLGVALDVTYINAVLEAWFERDPDVDIVGMWHTHPRDLNDLTLDDVAAAYTLREDTGQDIVVALASDSDGDAVRCFHLDAESTRGVGLEPVAYRVEGDAPVVTPVLPPIIPLASDLSQSTTPAAEPASDSTARIYDTSGTPAPSDTPAISTIADAPSWTTDDTDLVLPPARTMDTPPVAAEGSNRRMIMWAIYALVAFLVLFGLWRFFSGGGGNAPTGSVATAVAGVAAATTVEPTQPPTTAPTDAPTVAPTNTTAPTPTEQATATVEPTVAVVQTTDPAIGTTVVIDATSVATVDATVASAEATSVAPAEAAVTSVPSSLPYILAWTPMTSDEQTAFLARARAADCADCYNVDLIGPEPYRELRVRIDGRGGDRALRTFDRPALALVPPRTEPHTLQVYDTTNRAASTPITVTVTTGSYYMLRIQAAP